MLGNGQGTAGVAVGHAANAVKRPQNDAPFEPRPHTNKVHGDSG